MLEEGPGTLGVSRSPSNELSVFGGGREWAGMNGRQRTSIPQGGGSGIRQRENHLSSFPESGSTRPWSQKTSSQ